MNYDVRSITDYWESIPIDSADSLSLREFGPTNRGFSGGLDWSTSAGQTSILVVNGFAVRANGDLPSPGTSARVERAREAPTPELPYLVAVHGSGDQRLRRYTGGLPIETVVDELSGTSFTGYVELSEQVYSGDYYAVFHAGRSGFVALLSDERPPVYGEDARDQMFDEVGIYTVHGLHVDPVDLSAPPDERGEPVVDATAPTSVADEGAGDTRVFDTGSETRTEGNANETKLFRPDEGRDEEPTRRSDPGGGDEDHHDVYCPYCGKGVDADAFYCPLCGTRLE